MKVLIACEESQAVCIEFRRLGHEAFSCDLQECSGGFPEWHIQEDVFKVIGGGYYDLMIAHPPCTFLSNAGIAYFNEEKHGDKARERKVKRLEAEDFFMKLYNAPIGKICIENPVGFMNNKVKPTQVIHPYYFGDTDKKRTCLWLKNLPALVHDKEDNLFFSKTHVDVEPTYIDKSGKKRFFTEAMSGDGDARRKLRSKTFPGIAKAMAHQWSNF